jgi:hypothetical protein
MFIILAHDNLEVGRATLEYITSVLFCQSLFRKNSTSFLETALNERFGRRPPTITAKNADPRSDAGISEFRWIVASGSYFGGIISLEQIDPVGKRRKAWRTDRF